MAVSAQELNARRAATLLRCQKVREQRQQRYVRLADQACAAAKRAEQEARDAREAVRLAGIDRLRRAYDDLAGRVSGLNDVAALPSLRAEIDRQDQERERAVVEKEAVSRAAQGVAAAARATLLIEARASEKRSKLADRARASWRDAVEAAEEMERDEQVADTWRPA